MTAGPRTGSYRARGQLLLPSRCGARCDGHVLHNLAGCVTMWHVACMCTTLRVHTVEARFSVQCLVLPGGAASRVRLSGVVRGCGEGWASHFSVHARKESALIIEFVSESHVAELIQHQKVIDYTATYKWATTAIFGLLRPSTRISLGHTPPHGQTPSGPHTAAHGPALTSRACCAEPNGRDLTVP